MKAYLIRFWLATSGATAIEYAMIAAGIALARIKPGAGFSPDNALAL
jgi:Flp pilus assembly pilin Flp